MKSHYDFSAMLDLLEFDPDQPSFYLLNLGETHYPYILPGESGEDLPRIYGMHGVFRHMGDQILNAGSEESEKTFFNVGEMKALHEKQIANVTYLDGLFEKLYEMVPKNTYIMVMSDHGELFGEDGYFGHGPIVHEKVFEVFHVEGRLK